MSGIAGKLGVACVLLMMVLAATAQTQDVLKKNEATPQAFLDALTPATPDAPVPAERRTRTLKLMKSGEKYEGGGASAKPASVSKDGGREGGGKSENPASVSKIGGHEGGGRSENPASMSKSGEGFEGGGKSEKPASASVMITFETESSRLTADSKRILNNLAIALNSEKLARFRFNIEGHADARGTSERNLKLSQERAEAVREHLVSQFKIDPARLIALGKGDTEQLDKAHPAAAENRRVRIVTLTE
jgi:outer membrane protein OmpA-like peptidoglycan-associated protein